MAENPQRLGVFFGKNAKVGIAVQRTGEIDEIAVGFGRQSGIRQPWTDGLRDVERSRTLGKRLLGAVRKMDVDNVGHIWSGFLSLPERVGKGKRDDKEKAIVIEGGSKQRCGLG